MLSQPAPIPPTGQIHPFPPSSHPSPHLTVKFTPSRPAVILHLCWRPNSLLSTQRSSSTPAGAQIHPSQTSGHPLPHLAVKFTPPRPAVILHPCWRSTSPLPPAIGCFKGRGIKKGGLMKRGDERREAEDGIREAKDGRREMW